MKNKKQNLLYVSQCDKIKVVTEQTYRQLQRQGAHVKIFRKLDVDFER